MEADFWHERWNNSDIGFHQRNINAHLQQFWSRLSLVAGARVLVPLCGKSQDMIWLARQGHAVLGVELSPVAVGDFFRESGLSPQERWQDPFLAWETGDITLLCGDFLALTAATVSTVAGVYDRAALIALPPDMRKAYVDHLGAILPGSAEILLISLEYPQDIVKGPPFAVLEDEVRSLYGGRYGVDLLHVEEAPTKNQRFLASGLERVVEKVFHLHPSR